MQTLIGLLVVTATACAIARPSGPTEPVQQPLAKRDDGNSPRQRYFHEYLIPKLLIPKYYENDDMRVEPHYDHEWLNKEIERLNRMQDEEVESLPSIQVELSRWVPQESYLTRPHERATAQRLSQNYIPDSSRGEVATPLPSSKAILPTELIKDIHTPNPDDIQAKKQSFAMTPLDKGYFEVDHEVVPEQSEGPQEGGGMVSAYIEVPKRKTRQNPNLGRTKNLVAEDLERLRIGLTHDAPDGTEKLEALEDPSYTVAFIAAIIGITATAFITVFSLAFGLYKYSKSAKAAADVDYPAYGVTGPTIDSSGDRKLAHSAHMYHYQHQKQQIIAMERNCLEKRNGSMSDPESEEENEEGDYTVYECPGYATTGDMEVKNPLYSEDPTPATPGKCELVKPQPKE